MLSRGVKPHCSSKILHTRLYRLLEKESTMEYTIVLNIIGFDVSLTPIG